MRTKKWLLLAPLALACGTAQALGLGQIQVKSKPGEPLLAEIPVVSSQPDELNNLTAQLASPDTFTRVGLSAPKAWWLTCAFSWCRAKTGLLSFA